MFQVILSKIRVHYAGCPVCGLAAIDWRRANGLPDLADSLALVFDPDIFTDEALCRLLPDSLDNDADLVLNGTSVRILAYQAELLRSIGNANLNESPPSKEIRQALAALILAHA